MQQRAVRPAIQRELIVGGAEDPAEASAERAADAMMRAQAAQPGGSNDAVLRRACTAAPGTNDRERVITCDGGIWRVTRRTEEVAQQRQPETQFGAALNWNGRDIALDITICRGGTQFIISPGIHDVIEEVALPALQNLIQREAIGRGVSLRPGVRLIVRQSESWEDS